MAEAGMSDSWQDVDDTSRQVNTDEEVVEEYYNPELDFAEGIKEMESLGLVDIGALAAWTVSSFKPGSGIRELREDTPSTFWQSDSVQPHSLDIHFSKRVTISRVSFFIDYRMDESYTPSKIVVLGGNGFHDLLEVTTLDLATPSGWTHVVMSDFEGLETGLKVFLIRILIVANHQHGKDTHLRSVKIYSPSTQNLIDTSALGSFTSMKMLESSTIR